MHKIIQAWDRKRVDGAVKAEKTKFIDRGGTIHSFLWGEVIKLQCFDYVCKSVVNRT